MPSLEEVRSYLHNIPIQRLSDDTVEINMRFAESEVERKKSASASNDNIELAKLAVAGFLSYRSYADRVERGRGRTPPAISIQLAEYRTRMELALEIVRAGLPVVDFSLKMPESTYDEGV